MNKATIIGHLGKDPEMRYTPDGKAVTNFSVAVNDGKNADGSAKTAWWKVTAWERKAELAAEYLRKGSKVCLEGRPGVDQWTSKEGEPRADLTLTVAYMEFLSSRQDDDVQRERRAVGPGSPEWRTSQNNDDDLPF